MSSCTASWCEGYPSFFHVVLAAAHATGAAMTLAFANRDLTIATYSTHLSDLELADERWDELWSVDANVNTKWPLWALVLWMFTITAIAHVVYAYCGRWARDLRWVEYALSATPMTMMIGLTLGERDTGVLLIIGALTALTMVVGHFGDQLFDHRPAAASYSRVDLTKGCDGARQGTIDEVKVFLCGCALQAIVWFQLLWRFADTVAHSTRQPPDFVYAIVILEMLLYLSFACVQAWQVLYSGDLAPNAVKVRATWIFAALSLVSKGLLGGLLLGYVLAREHWSDAS
jgi:hypothetical protein